MMRSKHFCSIVALLVVLFLAGGITASMAAEWTVILNPEEADLNFELGSTLHTVHGVLHLVAGDLTFDSETGQASGLIRIDAKGVKTGNDKRDKKMHRQVLESATFPLFEYRVEKVEGTFKAEGDSELELAGTLVIHGTEHHCVVPVKVHSTNGQVTGIAWLMIPFVKWGMEDPSVFLFRVDKEIMVHVAVKGSLAAGKG